MCIRKCKINLFIKSIFYCYMQWMIYIILTKLRNISKTWFIFTICQQIPIILYKILKVFYSKFHLGRINKHAPTSTHPEFELVSCKPAGYPVPNSTRGRVPGKIRRVGSGTGCKKKFGPGTNMIAYPTGGDITAFRKF